MDKSTAADRAAEPVNAEMLTTHQVSELTGLTVKTLESYRTFRRRGLAKGPEFVTRGRAVLYPRAAVDAFLSQNREG